MAERAQITSVEAVEEFRSRLIVYQSSVRPALEEIQSEVMRTRMWLEQEQRPYWEAQIRKRMRVLEDANAAVFSAQLSNLREVSAAEQMAVRKAKKSLDEAQEKLRKVKLWERQFASSIEPIVRQTERLSTVLVHDLPKAAASLSQTVALLQDYTSSAPAAAAQPPSALPDTGTPGTPDPATGGAAT